MFVLALIASSDSVLHNLILPVLELFACQLKPELCSEGQRLLLIPVVRFLVYWAASHMLSDPESDNDR